MRARAAAVVLFIGSPSADTHPFPLPFFAQVMLAAMLDLVLHVVIVLDGAEKTHRSTHEWLMTVFPPDEVANEGDPVWLDWAVSAFAFADRHSPSSLFAVALPFPLVTL